MSGAGDVGEVLVHDALVGVAPLNSSRHDALVLVTAPGVTTPAPLAEAVASAVQLDKSLLKEASLVKCEAVAGGRLIISPTGPLTPYDDIRSLYEAVSAGLKRAVSAGARRPMLALRPLRPSPSPGDWSRSELVALLAALEALYVDFLWKYKIARGANRTLDGNIFWCLLKQPLEVRESYPDRIPRVEALGIWDAGVGASLPNLLREAIALERARAVARDIGGSDPERMSPPRVAEYLRGAFAGGEGGGGSAVRLSVVEGAEMSRRYPLLAAVARAADTVPRHRSCVIFLDYEPESYEETVMLVGKGVTYDTGGADVKTNGAMSGMSYDKCGAAAVAGFLKACELLRPSVRVRAALGMVRNSVGAESYVADELLRSRSGVPVRVGNTDAEGRLVMADLLCEMREMAQRDASAKVQLYTVATLTGHAVRAAGEGYGVAMDSHAALERRHAEKLQECGAALAEPLELSRLRREDLAVHRGRARGDALLQALPLPSVQVARGHQGPAAFLLMASGLHEAPLPYTHLDVAGSAGCFPSPPTAAPLLALAAAHGLITSC